MEQNTLIVREKSLVEFFKDHKGITQFRDEREKLMAAYDLVRLGAIVLPKTSLKENYKNVHFSLEDDSHRTKVPIFVVFKYRVCKYDDVSIILETSGQLPEVYFLEKGE